MCVIVANNKTPSATEELAEFKSQFLATEYETAHQRDCSFMTSRMVVKGWCLTVIAGIFYFLADRGLLGKFWYHLPIFLVILFFWILESEIAAYQKSSHDRIVYIEKMIGKFKNSQDLRDTIIREKIPYLFGKDRIEAAKRNFREVSFSKTILYFYLSLIVVNILCFLFSCIAGNRLVLGGEITSLSGSRNYILSSISQGLAAIFALAFTVTLVMTQISSKYSIRLIRLVLSKKTKLLIVCYAIGIIVPLIVMQFRSDVLLYLCIVWATVCIFFLVYYFFHIIPQFDPKSNFESILEGIDKDFVSFLKEKYEEWSRKGPPFIGDETSSRFWFNVPDDPLQIVLQIMISAMKDGDYETFTTALGKIRDTYCSAVNKDNERYLPFHFINVLNRCGKKIINENDDFLLLQLCLILKDMASFNAQRRFSSVSGKISSLLASYLEIALTQKDFSGIAWNIREIMQDIAREYVKKKLESSFIVHVSNLGNISTKITEKGFEKEVMDYINFIHMLSSLAIIGGSSFNSGLELLVSIIKDMGIESAKRGLIIPGGADTSETRLSEWSANSLKGLMKYMNGKEGFVKIREFTENCIDEIREVSS
jgi:hypothetical protein